MRFAKYPFVLSIIMLVSLLGTCIAFAQDLTSQQDTIQMYVEYEVLVPEGTYIDGTQGRVSAQLKEGTYFLVWQQAGNESCAEGAVWLNIGFVSFYPWNRAAFNGWVSVDDFVKIAESNGMTVPLCNAITNATPTPTPTPNWFSR